MFHPLNRTCNVVRSFELARNFTASAGVTNTYSPCKRLRLNSCCGQRYYTHTADFIQTVAIPAMNIGGIVGGTLTLSRFAYTVITDRSKRIDGEMIKLNDLIKKLDKLEQDIKKSYQESYTVIRPEDRATASKIKDLSTQCKFITLELEDSIARLEKYRFKNFKKDIELAKYKKLEVESYYYIAESVFHCEIKNYRDASKSIVKALRKYVEAIHSYDPKNTEEKFKNIETFLNYKLVNKKEVTLEEEYNFLKEISNEVSQLSKLQRENINLTLWYSDILTYISYVLFDSYSWEQKISDLGLIPAFFSIAATKVSANNYIAYNNAAYQYGHLGWPDIALKYLNQSIEKDALCTISHYNKGMLSFLFGEYAEATQVLTIAAKTIDPHYNYEKEKKLIPVGKAIPQVDKSISSFLPRALRHLSHLKNQNIHRVKHQKLYSKFLNIEKIIKQINVTNVSISNSDNPERNLESEKITQANLSFLQMITVSLLEIELCEKKEKALGEANNYFDRKGEAVIDTEKLENATTHLSDYIEEIEYRSSKEYIETALFHSSFHNL